MIQVINLSKSFEEQVVFQDINLEILDNETLVILGPSGQGKTVLIKTMNRLLWPDSGQVIYDDTDILKLDKRDFDEFRKQIAYVFQNSALFDFLNVHDNLALYLTMHHKLSKAAVRIKVLQALSFVGLDGETMEKFPDELSGGMRKRVAIARAMIKNPRYIYYDEPTTGLDKNNATKISELIRMLKKELQATSIIVTHDIKLMEEVADRVALLKDGKLVFVGPLRELSDNMLHFFYSGEIDELY